MYRAEVEIIISVKSSKVFELLADLPLLGEIHPHVKQITYTSDKTYGPGVKSHWIVKKPSQPEIEFDEEITEFQENKKLAFKTISGVKMTGEISLTDIGNETKVTFWEAIHEGPAPDMDAKRASMLAQLEAMKRYLEK
ncbi:MAG: SRPBCC family protein [Candidatus Ranarchaeia archaeon]